MTYRVIVGQRNDGGGPASRSSTHRSCR